MDIAWIAGERHAAHAASSVVDRDRDRAGRVRSLDILRGIAILLVICNHVGPDVIPNIPRLTGASGAIYWSIKQLGWSGVDLFFVLSGFLIGGLLLAEMENKDTIGCARFWGRRAFKIWPSYYVLLLVLGLSRATAFVDTSSVRSAAWTLLSHVFFLQNYLAENPNGPTWSLAVEEHFYLFLPVAILGARRLFGRDASRYLPPLVAATVAVCFALRIGEALSARTLVDAFKRTHFRLDALMIGVYTQHLWARRGRLLGWIAAHRAAAAAIAAALIAPAFFLSRARPAMFTAGFLALSVGYAILILLARDGIFGAWEETRGGRAIAAIGAYSYNIYLWHFFIPRLNVLWFNDVNDVIGRHVGHAIARLILQAAVYTAYSIALGALATRVVERPFLALRAKLAP